MAGLVPAIYVLLSFSEHAVRLYRHHRRDGILYIGVTSDLPRRIYEHREGLISGFTKRYDLKRLVWYEPHDSITAAIQREKTMKHWPRAWKIRLIHASNPEWTDLYNDLI